MFAEVSENSWRSWTWSEVWNTSFSFAVAILAHKINHRAAININGFNCPEWFFAFHATIMADCVAVGVYTTNSPVECEFVAESTGAELVLVEDLIQMQKYLDVLEQLPKLKVIVVYSIEKLEPRPHKIVKTWDEFLASSHTKNASQNKKLSQTIASRIENQVPGKCCDIVYTSGTTGVPKGVMLTHDNLYFVLRKMI